MDNAVTGRAWNRAIRGSLRIKRGAGIFLLGALIAFGLCVPAGALADTTLTVEFKGVTPSGTDNWLSLPLTAHFEVWANGAALGSVTANPTAAQQAGGESDSTPSAPSTVE